MMNVKDKAVELLAKLAAMSSAAVYVDAICAIYSAEEIDFYWRKIVKGE